MGCGRMRVELPFKTTLCRSRSIRASISRSTVSRKLLQWYWIWKESRSFPSKPSRISSCQGQTRNASRFGQGMCQNWRTIATDLLHHSWQKSEVVVLYENERRGRRPLPEPRPQTCRFTSTYVPSHRIDGSGSRRRCGTGATGPHSQSRSSNPLLPLWSARRDAENTSVPQEGRQRGHDDRQRTVSIAAAVGDPRSAGCTKDRVQRRNDAAVGLDLLDMYWGALDVNNRVALAVK